MTSGKKLSKSGSDDTLERRNKSYEKVLDAQIAWTRARQAGEPDDELLARWKNKSQWHEREHGW